MDHDTVVGNINGRLREIEKEEGVKILLAVESGSRAWGFPSKDSDYDIRFLYVHPPDWYLSVQERRDVIERPLEGLLDISGWDLLKALRLFWKSNPPLMEWLRSPTVYFENGETPALLRELSKTWFSPVHSIRHYLHMAEGNYREYLQGEQVRTKKYFYVLRPVLASRWVLRHGTPPPMEFQLLLEGQVAPGPLRQEILSLLEWKKTGCEIDRGPRIPRLNEYLDQSLSEIGLEVQRLPPNTVERSWETLDQIFRSSLK